MIHLSERLYKCTLCAETYSSKKTFGTHIKTHGLSSIRQSIGSAVVLSSDLTSISSVTRNPCGIGNQMVSSMSNNINPSFQNSNITDVRTHRQQLLPVSSSSGSVFLGRSVAVYQSTTNSVNGFLSSYCQKDQHLNVLNNGNSKNHHLDNDLTCFRPIPPLIPITAVQSTTPTTSNLIYSRQNYGSEHLHRQQFILSSSSKKFDEELEVIGVYGQHRISSDEKMMDQQALRSTSVIRFSH